jgi:hypothetical protein
MQIHVCILCLLDPMDSLERSVCWQHAALRDSRFFSGLENNLSDFDATPKTMRTANFAGVILRQIESGIGRVRSDYIEKHIAAV